MPVLSSAEVMNSATINSPLGNTVTDIKAGTRWGNALQAIQTEILKRVVIFKAPRMEPTKTPTYAEFQILVAKNQRCNCGGTCLHCQHIIKDAWRPEH